VAVVGCVHHLSDADCVEDVMQNRFFRLAGKADLGISHLKLAFSISYHQRLGAMSPKCLHSGDWSKWSDYKTLISGGSKRSKPVMCRRGKRRSVASLDIECVETSWRHQSASSLNNEVFFRHRIINPVTIIAWFASGGSEGGLESRWYKVSEKQKARPFPTVSRPIP
jgi:hypothetical protein